MVFRVGSVFWQVADGQEYERDGVHSLSGRKERTFLRKSLVFIEHGVVILPQYIHLIPLAMSVGTYYQHMVRSLTSFTTDSSVVSCANAILCSCIF